MRVCVIGLGYVGLPTACVIARAGHEVIGVDVNESVVRNLMNGTAKFLGEKDLGGLLASVLSLGRLKISTKPVPADVFVVAVQTPVRAPAVQPSGQTIVDVNAPVPVADLSYVEAAISSLTSVLDRGNLLVLESTVPPGTTAGMLPRILQANGVDPSTVLIAHAPERVLPGNVLHEIVHNSRVVGGVTPQAGHAAAEFYRTFVEGEVLVTDATTAEMVKLMENTFRDVNVALANEFLRIAEHLGVDIWQAIDIANRHPRVRILRPGPGVGGHCIPVDPHFLVQAAPHLTRLIRAAREVNEAMPHHVVDFLRRVAPGPLHRVTLLGVSYKANVADSRESPALKIAELLKAEGVSVNLHDPYLESYAGQITDAVRNSDGIVLVTDHDEYLRLRPEAIGSSMRSRLVLDTRGRLAPGPWLAAGFVFARLGSPFPRGSASSHRSGMDNATEAGNSAAVSHPESEGTLATGG